MHALIVAVTRHSSLRSALACICHCIVCVCVCVCVEGGGGGGGGGCGGGGGGGGGHHAGAKQPPLGDNHMQYVDSHCLIGVTKL